MLKERNPKRILFRLSSLITNVFKQSELTLSPMQHYDFKLRAALATIFDVIERKSVFVSSSENKPNEMDLIRRSIKSLINPILVKNVFVIEDSENSFKKFGLGSKYL